MKKEVIWSGQIQQNYVILQKKTAYNETTIPYYTTVEREVWK